MAFKLGNFNIDEILAGVAETKQDGLLYTLDQLSGAQIEISAESTDFTDKKGNVWRTTYTSKTGTFTATNAFLHPQILAAASGATPEYGTTESKIPMPKIKVVNAGTALDVTDAKNTAAIKVIGIFGNGANQKPKTAEEVTAMITSSTVEGETVKTLTLPAAGEDLPVSYLVKYEVDDAAGIKIVNDAYKFPDIVELTLYASYADPCDEALKGCYIVLPRFQADPNQTISLDRETQTIDFNGKLNIDFCSGTTKALYYIYFPSNDVVSSAVGV